MVQSLLKSIDSLDNMIMAVITFTDREATLLSDGLLIMIENAG